MRSLGVLLAVLAVPVIARGDTPEIAAQQEACMKGSLMSCNQLSVAYQNGRGVKKDMKRSVELSMVVCSATTTDDAQRGFACGRLADGYNSGKGIAKDIGKANQYYELSCSLGTMFACGIIGAAYAWGEGITKDVAKGRALLDKACKGGNTISCKQLDELAHPPKAGGGGTCPGNAEIRCGGKCVNIWKPDSRNCGGCGNVCPSNHFCNQGTCTMR